MELSYRSLLSKYALSFFFLLLFWQIVYLFMDNGLKNFNKKSFQKYVAISTSLEFEKDFYMFYLPMTCESWRRIGIEPIIIIVISDVNDSFVDLETYNYKSEINGKLINANLSILQLKVLEYLNRLKVKIFFFRSFKNYEAQLGMLARLFIGYISNEYIANENDYIIMSDTDIIPINHKYYDIDYSNDSISIWNAFCCSNFKYKNLHYSEYPMSHIGMKKYMWKNILTYDSQFEVFFNNNYKSNLDRVTNKGLFDPNRFEINSKVENFDLHTLNKQYRYDNY